MTGVLENMTLVETSERIIIHPSTLGRATRIMIINRISDEMTVSAESIPSAGILRTISICGIIGTINLVACPYLIIAKSRVQVGEISGGVIWKLNQYEIIPFRKTICHLSGKQAKYNSIYLDMLDTVLTTPSFYFSYTHDLSRNLQELSLNSPDVSRQTLIDRADRNFMWNSDLLERFSGHPECHKFCVSIIHGFVSINAVDVGSKHFRFTIISRRSTKRPGTRLFSRGVDADGHVSNFVETEQIVEYLGGITSFFQIRGSIPLFWTQNPNLKCKPKPQLSQVNQSEAFVKHFDELRHKYGRVVCVNLVNQSGSEAALETAFRNHIQSSAIPSVRYEAFDFHHECRNMNWGRTEILINRLSEEIEQFKFFARLPGKKQDQNGIFRTNCIDCLDRTNVIQSLLGRTNFEKVLQLMEILNNQERISSYPALEYLFKNTWADNGDICSIEYSGTGALKADFTRTGKRNAVGIYNDGYNSVVRYWKNNFYDGFRQDAIDLFLGNYTPEEHKTVAISPLEKSRSWKYYTIPACLFISMLLWGSVIMYPSKYSPQHYLGILVFGSVVFATGGAIIAYGTEFVDKPVLSTRIE